VGGGGAPRTCRQLSRRCSSPHLPSPAHLSSERTNQPETTCARTGTRRIYRGGFRDLKFCVIRVNPCPARPTCRPRARTSQRRPVHERGRRGGLCTINHATLHQATTTMTTTTTTTRADIFSFDFLLKGKNLLIPAAAGFFSLDATSGLLATASAPAPAMCLALRSALLCTCV